MRFKISIYGNDELWGSFSEEDFAALIAADAAFQRELRESGELVSAEGLADAGLVRVVRLRDGVRVVTMGPYLGGGEHPGSYFVVDCDSLDRALEVAARYPTASGNGVEVWPMLDHSGTEM
ncbi:YciI family protein [Phytomonospora sp. NPDC050363]|uniref:YciI family protein n=1 Tax=Phytomonospora sp. NPDC050363 TaxID=3155642 RepID=UPI0033F51129